MDKFGENLKFLREEKKLSQKALAEMIGTYPPRVSDWENNKSEPPLSMLNRLINALGIEYDDLLSYEVLDDNFKRLVETEQRKRETEKNSDLFPPYSGTTILSRIEELCFRYGITATELCRRAKISTSTVSNLKTGVNSSPSIETLYKLSAAVRISLKEFFNSDIFK